MRLFFVALLALPALSACYGPVSEDIESLGQDFETGSAASDIHVTGEDFACSQDMVKVGRMRIDNLLGLTEQAMQVARAPEGGRRYPVGTMLLGPPQEVMVKRGPGFSEETNDWEFLLIEYSEEGTRILDRGTTEVRGLSGRQCYGCHVEAEPEWDFVCQDGHGCADNPLLGPMMEYLVDTDPRCGPRLAAHL